MKKLNTFTGGHPLRLDDIAHLQDGIIDALKGVVNGLGANNQAFVLQGCTFPTPTTIAAGYIYWNGEVYPVDAGPKPALFLGAQYYWQVQEITVAPSPVIYQDLVSHIVHVRRKMTLVVSATLPVNAVLASSVIRLNQILGLTPQRGIIMYSGVSTNFDGSGKGKPGTQLDGWALCNGGTFAIPGGGTLTAPNLRGKFIVGFDERASGFDPDYNSIGDIGGEKTHTLTKGEIPKHEHGLFNSNTLVPRLEIIADTATGSGTLAPKVFHSDSATGGLTPFQPNYSPSEDGTVDGLAGAAHENRPPFYTLAYIIKLL